MSMQQKSCCIFCTAIAGQNGAPATLLRTINVYSDGCSSHVEAVITFVGRLVTGSTVAHRGKGPSTVGQLQLRELEGHEGSKLPGCFWKSFTALLGCSATRRCKPAAPSNGSHECLQPANQRFTYKSSWRCCLDFIA